MPRHLKVAAAQMGPSQDRTPGDEIIGRMLAFMDAAIVEGAQVVAYPELALTPYFPARIRDDADRFFSDEVPPGALAPVIERARGAGVTWLRPPAPGTLCADHVARAVHAAGGP